MAKPFARHLNHPELAALGAAIRKRRVTKGLSQEALAYEAGIDRSYMGGIERGEHNLAIVNLKKIADRLGVSLERLFRDAAL
jgi:transcriptional regulator with XRE-family HTH domain